MITYRDGVAGITSQHLEGGFFEGWPNPPSPKTHFKILAQSDEVVLALDEESGKVVGFITAITDGVLSAYIPFLEVLPEYRKREIGGELVRRMLERLKNFYMIDLVCDPELQPFYSRLGMRPTAGMMLRRYERQSGA